jgi:3-hydroxyisobutyrate dehydrogenase-like beta-hydroxyacid dehydrogenase
MAKVAFLGLGVMGYPMAGHLRKKGGHEVTVYNRTRAKAEQWAKEYGGKHAATPREAAKDCDFVMMCVGNDDDVRSVVYGPDGKDSGALAGMKRGAILVDHTTASAIVAREVFEKAKEKGIGFIDAPVSGGQAGAVNGQLGIMCGGEQATFDKAKPVIDLYAKLAALIGGPGAGQLTKMVNQICIAGLVQGLAEGLSFAKRAGLDVEKVVGVISKGAAQSWQMENRWKQMNEVKFDGFGFAVDWMRKDLGICMEEAKKNGARLPVSALVDQFYAHIQARGGKRWDTSSLMHLLMKD